MRSLTQFHPILAQFHAILAISAIFWPISTCWVSKCMYLSWEIQWWYFHTLSRTPSCNFMQFSHNFTQFSHNFTQVWLFQAFLANINMLGIKMHVLELKNSMVILSRTFPQSLIKVHEIFMHFHAILAISAIFGPISTCWVSKCMYSSWEI